LVAVAATKILFVVPDFVAVTKPFFPCRVAQEAKNSAFQIYRECQVDLL